MSIATRQPAAAIGGIQDWRSRSLFECMALAGFDPDEDGSEWVLLTSDIHMAENSADVKEWAEETRRELLALAAHPPDRIFILGDILTDYVPSFGRTPVTSYGDPEAAAAEAEMHHFTDLAPVDIVLGNHDTGPQESPLGAYLASKLTDFSAGAGLNHSRTVGGVRFVALSTSHDGSLVDGQLDFLAAEIATLGSEDLVIGVHQPGAGRAKEPTLIELFENISESLTNRIWMVSGHTHRHAEYCFDMGSTTMAQWQIGAGAEWVNSGDETAPSLSAMACRGGEVIARFSVDLKDGYWHYLADLDRSSPSAKYARLDGIAGETQLATYMEGEYDDTGVFQNGPGGGLWRRAGTWLSYTYDCQPKFPIPSGATVFWVLATTTPTTMELSDDGVSWTSVSVLSSASEIYRFAIPVALQSSADLYVRWKTSGESHIGGWGFL